ncbi:MAG: class I SAM-dependent methyltransferase [Terriglobales bacterium]
MKEPSVWSVLRRRWRETRTHKGFVGSVRDIGSDVWDFVRESTPERRPRRYGDVEYDWDHEVDTTAATVTNRSRLIAAISGAPYQPTDPAEFREMMETAAIDFPKFTFIDIGSGKGRTLLMASEFPFRRIVGVELLRELHRVAEKNIPAFSSPEQKCKEIELVCCDARDYVFPREAMLLYLFNPLPAAAMRVLLESLRRSLEAAPRAVRVVYHNPMSEHVLREAGFLRKVRGTEQYAIYSN